MKKRLITLALVLMLVVTVFAGCAKPNTDNYDSVDSDQIDSEPSNDDKTEDFSSSLTGSTPAESYARYVEAKGIAYDALSAKLDSSEELSFTGAMVLLSVALVDLYALPVTLLSGDDAASQIAASMFGMADMNINSSGENFTMTYMDSENNKITTEGQFDPSTDSLKCTITMPDSKFVMEYVKYKNGYAGQYYTENQDGTTSIIKIIVDGEDIAVGISDEGAQPASIYKKAPNDFTFVEDCASVIKLVGNQGSSLIDGVETEF